MHQDVDETNKIVKITLKPDKRYAPVCSKCKERIKEIHSYNTRTIRDLDIFDAKTFLEISYRTLKCPKCGNVVEELPLMASYKRVSQRLANYVLELCKYMTIKEVAEHLELDWKTVKEIHKHHLREKFSHEEKVNPKILVVD